MYVCLLAVASYSSHFMLKIWLQSIDTFYVSVNSRRSRLIEDHPAIKPRTKDDWDEEDRLEAISGLLLVVTPQQEASPVVYCELSRICAYWF